MLTLENESRCLPNSASPRPAVALAAKSRKVALGAAKALPKKLLPNQPHTLLVSLRPSQNTVTITVELDKKQCLKWKGPIEEVAALDGPIEELSTIVLSIGGLSTVVHKAKLRLEPSETETAPDVPHDIVSGQEIDEATPQEHSSNGRLNELLEQLKAPEPRQRRQAAMELSRLRLGDVEVIMALRVAMSDPDSAVRDAAIFAIGSIGTPAVEAVPALIKLWKSDPAVRRTVLNALGRMAAESKPALKEIIDIARGGEDGEARPLEKANREARMEACSVLGTIGPAASSAVPVLIGTLRLAAKDVDHQLETYKTVAAALAKIGDSRAIPVLRHHKEGKDLRGSKPIVAAAIVVADTAIRSLKEFAEKSDADEPAGLDAPEPVDSRATR